MDCVCAATCRAKCFRSSSQGCRDFFPLHERIQFGAPPSCLGNILLCFEYCTSELCIFVGFLCHCQRPTLSADLRSGKTALEEKKGRVQISVNGFTSRYNDSTVARKYMVAIYPLNVRDFGVGSQLGLEAERPRTKTRFIARSGSHIVKLTFQSRCGLQWLSEGVGTT